MKCCRIWLIRIRRLFKNVATVLVNHINMAEEIKQRCGRPHCVHGWRDSLSACLLPWCPSSPETWADSHWMRSAVTPNQRRGIQKRARCSQTARPQVTFAAFMDEQNIALRMCLVCSHKKYPSQPFQSGTTSWSRTPKVSLFCVSKLKKVE